MDYGSGAIVMIHDLDTLPDIYHKISLAAGHKTNINREVTTKVW